MISQWLAAAPGPTNSPWDFGVFGIGAIVFVVISTWLYYALKQVAARDLKIEQKDTQIAQLQEARLDDAIRSAELYRQLSERTVPILGDTAKFLDASLANARAAASQPEWNEALARMEAIAAKLARDSR